METLENSLKETNDKLTSTNFELTFTKAKLIKNEKDNEIEMKQLNQKIGLLNEINNQSEIFNKNINDILNYKINSLLNSYRILFMRKFVNFMLEGIIDYNKEGLAKSKQFFYNDRSKFHLIIATKKIKSIF